LRRFELPGLAHGLTPVTEVLRAALTAAATAAALSLLALHYYDTRLTATRLALLVACTALAVPAFGLLDIWLAQARARGAEVVVRLILALTTAALSVLLFGRMAVVPGLLVTAVLVFSAAYRYGHGHRSPLATFVFETLLLGWLGAVALPLY
jgi:hypothetical protein